VNRAQAVVGRATGRAQGPVHAIQGVAANSVQSSGTASSLASGVAGNASPAAAAASGSTDQQSNGAVAAKPGLPSPLTHGIDGKDMSVDLSGSGAAGGNANSQTTRITGTGATPASHAASTAAGSARAGGQAAAHGSAGNGISASAQADGGAGAGVNAQQH
jgi:hypothetical protein